MNNYIKLLRNNLYKNLSIPLHCFINSIRRNSLRMSKILISSIFDLNTIRHILTDCIIEIINNKKKNYTYVIYFFDDIIKCKSYYKYFYDFKKNNNINNNKLLFMLLKRKRNSWKTILHNLILQKYLIYYRFDYYQQQNEINCNILLFINKYTKPIIINYINNNLQICKNNLYKLAVEKIFII